MKKINFKTLSFLGAILFGLVLLWPANHASAASLYLSPSSGSYEVGASFSVSAYVSSAHQAMNAASGVISFPADKLQVTSLSKSGSVFSLWAQEPSFSNSAGTVNFEGIVLNPGYKGNSGRIITINFKIKAAGSAPVSLGSGAVLANDGKGTNIISGLGSAKFSLKEKAEIPVVTLETTPEVAPTSEVKPTTETTTVASTPQISSDTNPDQNSWYASSNVNFSWNLPSDITAVRLAADKEPDSAPVVSYIPPIKEKSLSDMEDGVWYFHVQFKNKKGWGEIAHYRFQIDTEKPTDFSIVSASTNLATDTQPKFIFTANDKTSGIDRYEIKIDDGEAIVWQDDGTHQYKTPVLAPGNHTLAVKALDKAGNFLEQSNFFSIESLPVQTLPINPVVKENVNLSPSLIIFNILALIISILALVFSTFLFTKNLKMQKKDGKKIKETELKLHRVFRVLKEDVEREIAMYEKTKKKRRLKPEEEKIVRRLRKDLGLAESYLDKEISKIFKK